jgi:hypothetical protein
LIEERNPVMKILKELGYIVQETRGVGSTYREASDHTKCTALTANAWNVAGTRVKC